MSAHPRLFRRGSTYYHRAAIPVDIKATYPKTEETFSLDTKDYREALKRVRVAAVRVDDRFEKHRQGLTRRVETAPEDASKGQCKRNEAFHHEPSPEQVLDICRAEFDRPPFARVKTQPVDTQRNSRPSPEGRHKLSELVMEWASEKARTSWTEKTEREHRVWMGHFITLVGDRVITTYGKEDGRAFKKLLMELPANWNKQKPLKGLSVNIAASKAKALGLAPMSDKNMNKLIGYVGSFWSWAEKNYDDCPNNPLRNLKVPMRNRSVRDERDPFSVEELTAIFTAPLYTGCESLRKYAERGSLIPNDTGVFWVPLIGLFTGARVGEIIQLYVEDIREKNGITFIHINEDGEDKRLKTPHSLRSIPIHSTLISLGFLRHVELRRKQGHQRLFPEMKLGHDGYYSSPFSKHFSRFLRSLEIKSSTNSFHSFRHSFEDACRDSRISREVMDALQGHSERGMSGRYGRGFALEMLAEEMARIRYKGLDLSHLQPKN